MRDGVKKDITPRGDGNVKPSLASNTFALIVKKDITPRGDGNFCSINSLTVIFIYCKKRHNPERGRKL